MTEDTEESYEEFRLKMGIYKKILEENKEYKNNLKTMCITVEATFKGGDRELEILEGLFALFDPHTIIIKEAKD